MERPQVVAETESRVRVLGSLDAFSAADIEEELGSLAADRPVLTVDLSEVELLTSGGLAMLERCRALAAGGRNRMLFHAEPGTLVHRVLQVAETSGPEPAPRDAHPADGTARSSRTAKPLGPPNPEPPNTEPPNTEPPNTEPPNP